MFMIWIAHLDQSFKSIPMISTECLTRYLCTTFWDSIVWISVRGWSKRNRASYNSIRDRRKYQQPLQFACTSKHVLQQINNTHIRNQFGIANHYKYHLPNTSIQTEKLKTYCSINMAAHDAILSFHPFIILVLVAISTSKIAEVPQCYGNCYTGCV